MATTPRPDTLARDEEWRVHVWRASALTVEDVRAGRGARLRGHGHDDAHLLVMLGGELAERDRGRTREVGRGMLRFSPAGDQHDIRFHAPTHCLLLLLGRALEAETAGVAPAARLFATDTVVERLAHSLVSELAREHDPLSPIAAQALALELVARVSLAGRTSGVRAPSWLAHALEALHASPGFPPHARTLAIEAGVHPVHLARVFRRHTGCGLGEYARRLRAELALRRLSRSDAPLAAIAADTGYADQAHLTRSLRRLVGLTPTEVRRRGSAWLEVAGVQERGRRLA